MIYAGTHKFLKLIKTMATNNLIQVVSQTTTVTTEMVDIGGMRKPYKGSNEPFLESDLVSKEPFGQFRHWFEQACETPGILEANAMCLATASKDGRPSARMVLLKGYGKDGFRFFTNYSSQKGSHLEENPYAALNFYWEPLLRSVRIEGRVEKLSKEESEDYFHSRPRSSQIGACVSNQSQPIVSREVLIQKEQELLQEYADETKIIPKPEIWGGYRVIPDLVEFWQGQTTRIHDRIRFRRPLKDSEPDDVLTHSGEDGWIYERLSP